MAMLRDRILPFLDELRTRKVTNRAIAARLGVSEEHVSRTLKELGVVKTSAKEAREAFKAARKALVAARYEHRATVAKTMAPRQAARAAKCSLRTIYRWRDKC